MKKILKKTLVILFILFVIGLIIFTIKKTTSKPLQIIGNTKWKITQFGDNIGSQMMCFTIEGNDNGLVIIDGGYKDNEDQYNFLMQKISEHNNIIDAWIVTHFDDDHGGQFVRIAQLEDVEIKNIFVPDTPADMDLLKENAPYEGDWSIYEEYLTLELPQKVKVHPKDKFEFIGLRMEVLCSYEDWIDEQCDNLLNNGAMVFKIYGNKESLLFCGDVQSKPIGEYLLKNCKSKLKSDYLQVAHHGNNWLGEDFYKAVSPKVAFFPAPDWLMENTGNVSWFTVKENRALLEELGSKILWNNTSPNEITFE